MRFLPSSPAKAFWLVSALACVVSLLVIGVAPWAGIPNKFGGEEQDGYLELARSLLAGDGFVFEAGGPPVLHRPPLYPLFLVPVAALPEALQRPGLILVQSALLGGVAAFVWRIGARLFGPATGRVAVGLMLLNPWLFWVVKNPMHIPLQAFLYTTFCWLLLRAFAADRAGGWRPAPGCDRRVALLLGLNAGALALVHGTMLVTCGVLLAGACLWRLWAGDVRSAARVVAAIVLMTAVVAPWTARNWLTFGAVIPVVGNAGFTYFAGNAHWGIGKDPVRRKESAYQAALRHAGIDRPAREVIHFWGSKDPGLDAEMTRRMVEHARGRPDELLRKLFLNAGEFYFPLLNPLYLRSGAADAPSWARLATTRLRATAITLFHGVLWALCLAALARGPRRPDGRVLALLGLVAVFPLPFLPFLVYIGHSQYVLPTIPLLSVLAAVGLGAARNRTPAS